MSAPTDPDVPTAVTYREVQEILRTFRDSGWTGMTVELHGMRITVGKDGPPGWSRGPAASGVVPATPSTSDDLAAAVPAVAPGSGASSASASAPVAVAHGVSVSPSIAPAPPGPGGADEDLSGCVAVRSPAVGAFWVAPSPGRPPFVQVGQAVAQDEQLAIVEVMKLMNPVVATAAGTVVRVCATDSDLVEYEQILFWIRPADG